MPSRRHLDSDETLPESEAALDSISDFEDLYRRYFNMVRGYFIQRGVTSDEASELTQETFLSAFRGRKRFRGDAHSSTWLLVISRNIFSNYIRSKRAAMRDRTEVSLQQLEEENEPVTNIQDPDPDVLDRSLEKEQQRLLAEAIEELPQRIRQIMRLAFVNDLKYKDIADLLGISINTVKSPVHQGKMKLSKYVSQQALGFNADLEGDK